eukprot:TRINITY_DN26215_c0_g1_i1.p1 TRINITY_DN26215_c0_g1~~TRINITY_DN26215_c0_g1_i1.p1  ORF type:complete len:768 (+),score=280.04 TRINITY_DN26215_c0_g1_i1:35-2338(+)
MNKLSLAVLLSCVCSAAAGNWTVANDKFYKDGQEFQIMAGSLHYSRTPAFYWKDLVQRMKAMGLNTVQTYVPWNWHETNQGEFLWTGDHDLAGFLKICQDEGMIVMLRGGPYMCGEWEFGGFPAWILNHNVTIRTYEPNYIALVTAYFKELHAQIKPLLYSNGGPVVMIQIENEYGSYGDVASNPNDLKYMEYLAQLVHQNLGQDAVAIYTTDGGSTSYMERGTIKGDTVLTFGDHGPGDFDSSCAAQADFNPPGKNPCMDTEYYTGWLTHWGEDMANTSSATVAQYLDIALGKGYSFSLYMGFGGSNFGWMAGANGGGSSYSPHITSYDYDSPISENGDHGYGSDNIDKFEAIKAVLKKYNNNIPAEPVNRIRTAYGAVKLTARADMLAADSLKILAGNPKTSSKPVNMEVYGQNYGFIMYSTLAASGGDTLEIAGYPRDRAQVFVNDKKIGAIYRPQNQPLNGLGAVTGSKIDILVEAMGRLNYGGGMTDPKGLVDAVTLDKNPLGPNWLVYNMPLNYSSVSSLTFSSNTNTTSGPAFYKGTLNINGAPTDTYVSTLGFEKGMVWVNGFNLGRYWESQGPQHALFLPADKLKTGANDVVVLELDQAKADLTIAFTDAPNFSGKPPPKCQDTVTAGTTLTIFTCNLPNFQSFTQSDAGNGEFTLSINNLCLTVGPGSDPSSGSPSAQLEACSGAANQKFSQSGSAIKNGNNCLDITSHNTADGSNIEWYSCNSGTNQQWSIKQTPAHTYQIVTAENGKCATACSTA